MADRLGRALATSRDPVRRPRWSSEPCDDIQGPRRDAIIQEHLEWLASKDAYLTLDWSEAPLAVWLHKHQRSLAIHRKGSNGYYRNTKTAGVRHAVTSGLEGVQYRRVLSGPARIP